MKILITGAKGQLGRELARQLARTEHSFDAVDVDEMDITDLRAVRKTILGAQPAYTHIISCAAYTNVDGCETNAEAAYAVNAVGARNLAIAAEECGAELIQISTDYVFAGNDERPQTVYDIPLPVSVYGKTKLAGESYVRDFCSKYYIVRTAWLYGREGGNFVRTMQRLANEREVVRVVSDQIGSPTNAADLATALLLLAETGEYGIYHCTGKGSCSWYDFADKIAVLSGCGGRIEPCTTEEYAKLVTNQAKRPAYSALDNSALISLGIDVMRGWEEAIEDFIRTDKQ